MNVKIDQLPDRHPPVDANRLPNRDFERPRVAKPDVALPCSRVDVNSQPADATLSFEEGDMPMRFGVFLCYAKIKFARDKRDAFDRYLKMRYPVVQSCIKDFVAVYSEPTSKVDIVGIGTEIDAPKRLYDDRSPFYFRKNLVVRKDHESVRFKHPALKEVSRWSSRRVFRENSLN